MRRRHSSHRGRSGIHLRGLILFWLLWLAGPVLLQAQPVSDLEVTAEPDIAVLGEDLSYTLSVVNRGSVTATNVVVVDTLPAGLTFLGATGSGWVCDESNGVVTCSRPTLGVNAGSPSLIQVVLSPPGALGYVTNSAGVSSTLTDPNPDNNTNILVTEVVAPVDVALFKDGPTQAYESVRYDYQLTVTNATLFPATNVVVKDVFPAGMVYVGSAASGWSTFYDAPSRTFSALLPNLPAQGVSTIILTVVAGAGTAGTSLTNTATVTLPGQPESMPGDNSSTVVTAVEPAADLRVTKLGGVDRTTSPDTYQYVVTLANLGSGTATNITVTDVLIYTGGSFPVAFDSAVVSSGTFTPSGTPVASEGGVWVLPAMASNAVETLTLTYLGNSNDTFTNNATVTSDTFDPNPDNNSMEVVVSQRLNLVDLAVQKYDSIDPVDGGSNYTYSIVVTNLSDKDWKAQGSLLTVVDSLPTSVTFVSAFGVDWTFVYDSGTHRVTGTFNGQVKKDVVDRSETFDITVTAPLTPGIVTNEVAMSYTSESAVDPNAENDIFRETTTVSVNTDIAVGKSVSDSAPPVGSNVVFTVTAENLGDFRSDNIVLTDVLPAGLTFFSASATHGVYDDSVGRWLVGSLDSGATAVLSLTATVGASGTITNVVSLTGVTQTDTNASNNTAFSVINGLAADLGLGKSVDVATPNVLSNVTFTISLTNYGPTTADAIVVRDLLPAGFSFVSHAASSGSYDSGSGYWGVPSLASNAVATLTLVAQVTSAGTLTNRAEVVASSLEDPDPGNNVAIVVLEGQQVDLAVGKTVDEPRPGILGTNLVFTISVTNLGPSAATGVILQDQLPPGLGYVSHVVSQGSYNPGSGAWNVGGLANGVRATLALTATNAIEGILTNGVSVIAVGQTDTNAANDTATVTLLSGVNQSSVGGRVFKDDGAGGGTANDGVLNGAEPGLGGVTVRLTDAGGGTEYARAVTDGAGEYLLVIPQSLTDGASLRLVEVNPPNHLSTGGSAGDTGGSYDRAADEIAFSYVSGTGYTGVDFGDVPANSFVADGVLAGLPGSFVVYPHTFVAGSEGTVTFSVTNQPNPALPGWNQVIYSDANCNAQLDPSDPALNAGVPVVAGQKLCLLIKHFIPLAAPLNAQDLLSVTASFTYANAVPALMGAAQLHDLTTVGAPTTAGLVLIKVVDKDTALPGDPVTYTINYLNNASEPLRNVMIYDQTPAFTTFTSTNTVILPASLTGVTINTPSPGQPGGLSWAFTGELAPGSSGSVSYSVTVEQ